MSIRILIGDCRERLRELPDASVHCCVTSPPYFGLRDYGTAQWEGGDEGCDHKQTTARRDGGRAKVGAFKGSTAANSDKGAMNYREVCGKCGATRIDRQMGLEPTPDEFVAGMVEVFREVRRVLRDDGTLWLNIGDSYASDSKGSGGPSVKQLSNAGSRYETRKFNHGVKQKDLVGIPWMLAFALRQPWTDWQIKDEAMRAWVAGIVDGEGCITIQKTKSSHSDSLSFPPIVQVKMCDREPLDRLVAVAGSKIGEAQFPPSHAAANQRPSWQWKVSAERAAKVIAEIYPFLTCKRKQAIVAWNHQQFRSQRGNQARAQSDLEREQFCKALINDLNQRSPVDLPSWMIEPKIIQEPGWYLRQDCIWSKPNPMPESVRDRCTKAHEYLFLLSKGPRYYYDAEAIKEDGVCPAGTKAAKGSVERFGQDGVNSRPPEYKIYDGTRNKRSVWEVATQPFSEAHFATYPPALIEPCILAGCPERCCAKCGAPWVMREVLAGATERASPEVYTGAAYANPQSAPRGPKKNFGAGRESSGDRGPSCTCHDGVTRGTVLDPFGGAGTTGLVADRLQRDAILIELNPEYAEIARKRIAEEAGMFGSINVDRQAA